MRKHRGAQGLLVPAEPELFPIDPLFGATRTPRPLLRPCQRPAGPWDGRRRILPELCRFLRGLPNSRPPLRAAREGQCPDRSWGSDQPTAENHSGLQLPSFLRGQSRLQSGHSQTELTGPGPLPSQVS